MIRLPRVLLVLFVATAMVPLVAPSATAAAPEIVLQSEFRTPAMPHFKNVSNTPELFSSPTVGDIDGDGQADVVAGYQNGHVYAWHQNGARFLDITTPGAGSIRATPVLVDLNKDGKLDILGSSQAGYVYAYDGHGHRLFLAATPVYNNLRSVFAAPVAADINGDGVLEIIVTGHDHYLWVWDLAGHRKRGFPVFMADTIWSSPAIADLNGDGKRDIVFGYDCAGGSGSRCAGMSRTGGGFDTAIDSTGRALPGWPRFIAGQTVWSTPAIADITGDGRPDVVVGTGLYSPSPAGSQVNAYDRAGHVLPGFPVRTRGRVMGSPAIGDLNGDGKPEISAMDEHNWVWLWDSRGHVVPGWPVCGGNSGHCDNIAHAGSVIADVTGDGHPDVIAAGQTTLRVIDYGGHVLTSARTPLGVSGVSAAPTVATLGGKATVLLNSTHHNSNGDVTGTVVRFSTGAMPGPAPWPMFRQNTRGTSHVDDFVPPSVTTVTAGAVSRTMVRVTMTATDAGSGVAAFDAWFRDNGGALFHWLPGTAPTSRSGTSATHTRTFGAKPNHTYRIQARARDKDGNWGHWGVTTVSTPG